MTLPEWLRKGELQEIHGFLVYRPPASATTAEILSGYASSGATGILLDRTLGFSGGFPLVAAIRDLQYLRIGLQYNRTEDLSFLGSLPGIVELSVRGNARGIYLGGLPHLKTLVYESLKLPREIIEALVAGLPLESLALVDTGGSHLPNLRACSELKNLTVISPKGLRVTEQETLPISLTKLDIRAARALASIDQSLAQALEKLSLSTCRRISDLNFLSGSSVTTLEIINGPSLDTLEPVLSCSNLQTFLFTESTNVVDGRVRRLLNLPKLEVVRFTDRSHYDVRLDAMAVFLAARIDPNS